MLLNLFLKNKIERKKKKKNVFLFSLNNRCSADRVQGDLLLHLVKKKKNKQNKTQNKNRMKQEKEKYLYLLSSVVQPNASFSYRA